VKQTLLPFRTNGRFQVGTDSANDFPHLTSFVCDQMWELSGARWQGAVKADKPLTSRGDVPHNTS